MTPTPRPIKTMGTDELRLACVSLRHEMTQIRHWRRLVRARLDLTVARAVLPERLGQPVAAHAAIDSADGPSVGPAAAHGVLVDIARVPDAGLSMTDLPELRSAEEALAAYETAIRTALMNADDALMERLSADLAATAFPCPSSPLGLDAAEPGTAPRPVP